jgi:hypothetical protein
MQLQLHACSSMLLLLMSSPVLSKPSTPTQRGTTCSSVQLAVCLCLPLLLLLQQHFSEAVPVQADLDACFC